MKLELKAEPGWLLEHYEALRREALDGTRNGERGHGLALFLARGMIAWLDALRALTPTPSQGSTAGATQKPPLDRAPIPPPSVRVELTMMLAGMVLALSAEGGRAG